MTMPGPASPPIASTETVNSRATPPFLGTKSEVLALCLHDFAVGIVTARATDMMRALGLAAFGALRVRGCRECVMRAAHIAARRRGFSFWHRHGGKLLQKPCRRRRGLK